MSLATRASPDSSQSPSYTRPPCRLLLFASSFSSSAFSCQPQPIKRCCMPRTVTVTLTDLKTVSAGDDGKNNDFCLAREDLRGRTRDYYACVFAVFVCVGGWSVCGCVCVCGCGMLICFVSALGSHEMGRHKLPIVFIINVVAAAIVVVVAVVSFVVVVADDIVVSFSC